MQRKHLRTQSKKQTNKVYKDGQKITVNGSNLYLSKRSPKVTRAITAIFAVLIIVLILLVTLKSCERQEIHHAEATPDEQSVRWNGEQYISKPPSQNYQGSYIPGFDVLNLVANTTEQKVNFYNPAENTCIFKLYLYVDGELVWNSGYLKPGFGFYNITLSHGFTPKECKGYMKIECYSAQELKLTKSVNINFDVIIY